MEYCASPVEPPGDNERSGSLDAEQKAMSLDQYVS
jgi:hypothetical protein